MNTTYVLKLRGKGEFQYVRILEDRAESSPKAGFINTSILRASTFSSALEALEFADQFPEEAMQVMKVEV